MDIKAFGDTLLDESQSDFQLREALGLFAQYCSDVTGIEPDTTFDAWANDSLLQDGVAINPQAAAQCALDYRRSVVFIRGVYCALRSLQHRLPNTQLSVLYAGCGPFATLLLPLLARFSPTEIDITLLDIHDQSLTSVRQLLTHFGLLKYTVQTIQGDACQYLHPTKLHLVIAETMQKALEQEPQFAVTANLAPQLHPLGVFVPQQIDVSLCMTDTAAEARQLQHGRHSQVTPNNMPPQCLTLATLCRLRAADAPSQLRDAQYNEALLARELTAITVEIPSAAVAAGLEPTLLTRISVFGPHQLNEYESEITLPLACHDLGQLVGGETIRVSYQLGSYPRFNLEKLLSK